MKAGLYFIGLMLFVLMFVMFDYSVRKDYLTMMKYKNNQNTNIVTEIAMQQPIAKPESMNLTALVDQMNKYKFDPDQGEEFIERLGQGLSADQIVYLGEVIRNSDETESRRNLALNLLAKNQGLKAFDEIILMSEVLGVSASGYYAWWPGVRAGPAPGPAPAGRNKHRPSAARCHARHSRSR